MDTNDGSQTQAQPSRYMMAEAERKMRGTLVEVLRERHPEDAGMDNAALIAKYIKPEDLGRLILHEAKRLEACEQLDRILLNVG